MTDNELKVMSFNIWNVPFSADKRERLHAFSQALARSDLDIIGLQEVWEPKSVAVIANGAKAGGMAHSHYYRSTGAGSGMMILSRYPIVDVHFHRFRIDGNRSSFWSVHHYLVGKGIAFARIKTPRGPVDVFNTHLAPRYGYATDIHATYRAAQTYEIARTIARTNTNNPIVLLGDLNMQPYESGHRLLKALIGLRDASEEGTYMPPDTYTADNPYIDPLDKQRIDYVFVRDGRDTILRVTDASLGFTYLPHAGRNKAYSDHFAVVTTVKMESTSNNALPVITDRQREIAFKELSGILHSGIRGALHRQNQSHWKARLALIALLPLWLLPFPLRRIITSLFSGYAVAHAGMAMASLRDDVAGLQGIAMEIELRRAAWADEAQNDQEPVDQTLLNT